MALINTGLQYNLQASKINWIQTLAIEIDAAITFINKHMNRNAINLT
jgi:ribosomal protein L16/L10AE